MAEEKNGFESWAIIEIMGHQRLAGMVREETIAGTALLRIDVPECPAGNHFGHEVPAIPPFTTYISAGSIYRMTPCTEEVARAAIQQFREVPINCVRMPERAALPGSDPDEPNLFGDDQDN